MPLPYKNTKYLQTIYGQLSWRVSLAFLFWRSWSSVFRRWRSRWQSALYLRMDTYHSYSLGFFCKSLRCVNVRASDGIASSSTLAFTDTKSLLVILKRQLLGPNTCIKFKGTTACISQSLRNIDRLAMSIHTFTMLAVYT